MAKTDWGTKRNCLSCSSKFYDFNKNPILCPSCGEELVLEKPVRIKATKKNNAKPSKDGSPETEILENNEKDISIILDDDIINEHIGVGSNLEENNNENDDVIEVDVDQDDGLQSIGDNSQSIDSEEG